MKLPRRNFLHLAAGAAALPAVSRTARAQAYPTRPVRIIVAHQPALRSELAIRSDRGNRVAVATTVKHSRGGQFVSSLAGENV
jgi:hypothetical protein